MRIAAYYIANHIKGVAMAYIREIINATMDNCIDYRITIIGSCCVICEGFRSVVTFSTTEIVLRAGRIFIELSGEDLVIKELSSSYICVCGNIISVSKRKEIK